ncbi:HAD family hydrolase [Weissella diestrammenae]|uniref:HAD family hydrolase n=1 Tax=Weissella diestrammenae TaxID=1162633 RepID=A0A7G9T777_9LACO|nr:Cof-type HAD-IIB family hydrolase [Weissella diestrammenae]MCM0582445.1 HAD family hydrolase [Weissella diestrammenae]QNN75952.1 HAD family hydrolase [Weissella diestrammenae]
MTYPKLFATDLDGTFLNDYKKFNRRRFTEILAQLETQQAHFVVATGRDIDMIQKDFADYLGKIDIVANNGALVVAADGTVLHTQTLASTAVIDAVDAIESMPFKLTRGAVFVSAHHKYMLKRHKDFSITNLVFRRLVGVTTYIDDLSEIEEPILKITFGFEADDTMLFIQQAQAKLGEHAHVTTSGYGSVDIVGPGINKAAGIQYVANHYGLALADDLVAFGDGLNDLEMLKAAKYPFAMPNGDEGLTEMFPLAVADNNHAGVLETIATDPFIDGDI